MAKHYIRLDAQNRIIKGFSDAFEQPLETDICINSDGGRQFELLGEINPSLVNIKGIYLYKYENNEVILRTDTEIAADVNSLPPQPKSQLEILQETVDALVIASLGV